MKRIILPVVSYECERAELRFGVRSTRGEKRNACRILVENPVRKRSLRRHRRRWVDSIKMDLRGVGWGGMDRIDLADHGNEPSSYIKKLENF
jgi:hypothetical protein